MERKAGTATPRRYTPRLPPEERRNQILDAVLAVIAEQGAAAVTVDGIARRLGFTRPVVHAHFKDADDLLRGSLAREEERALAQLLAVIPGDTPGDPPGTVEDIARSFRAYLEAVLAEPLRWRAILLPIGPPPALLSRVRRGRDRVLKLLAARVEAAAPPEVDHTLAALMIMTLAEEAGRLVLTAPHEFTVERLAAFADSVTPGVLHAIRG